MDIDKIIDEVERYVSEFILYLVSFFTGRKESQPDTALPLENNVIVFSILSAILGSYITRRFGQNTILAGDDLLSTAIAEILWWIALGVFLYTIMAIAKPRPHIMECITAVLKTLPVAYVICAFIAYVVFSFFNILGPLANLKTVAANWAASLFELVFITLYLHKGFPPLPEGDPAEIKAVARDRWWGIFWLLLLVYAKVAITNASWIAANQAFFAKEAQWISREWNFLFHSR